ncbi:hypothetical protein Geob_2413 [Geotalea daltonii FRC-32]|uniref:Uncharacterized protein n=1 Tax=Geotalea daltonii (strain DSM 22248 / JCM 15807 / FRC-32) TaxID=316067 RepID=B9LZY6_GEODF|nr:hypothetical protein [Geotalea daltonii]ACM20766.1 hypothetical protein Geob_2413 [Geotalea daltonii FRC-32]
MDCIRMPSEEAVYTVEPGKLVIFNQLAVKVEMDNVTNEQYYQWLDEMKDCIDGLVHGAKIVEKENARVTPPLNTAIYYDTEDYKILNTGALLRTSCNKITHAFCAFKEASDSHSVRRDHRYVFAGDEKKTIQNGPDSIEAVSIVKSLLKRKDIDQPGLHLEQKLGIRGTDLIPSIRLDDYRFTFFVWLDKKDALRCSIDRAHVSNLRLPEDKRKSCPVSEVELAIYPRISPEVAKDPRVVKLIEVLSQSLGNRFGVSITKKIKYQRAAQVLGIFDN